ncbi:MAG TPA: YlxR family protein [Acidimicrobiia bacterium]
MTGRGPRRTCVGCRRTAPVAELVRLRWTPTGVELGKGPGRGAWLCAGDPAACLELAQRKPTLARALRAPVTTDDLVGVRARLTST